MSPVVSELLRRLARLADRVSTLDRRSRWMEESRDNWRCLAIERGREAKRQRERAKRQYARAELWKARAMADQIAREVTRR